MKKMTTIICFLLIQGLVFAESPPPVKGNPLPAPKLGEPMPDTRPEFRYMRQAPTSDAERQQMYNQGISPSNYKYRRSSPNYPRIIVGSRRRRPRGRVPYGGYNYGYTTNREVYHDLEATVIQLKEYIRKLEARISVLEKENTELLQAIDNVAQTEPEIGVFYDVVDVIDGDTLDIMVDGVKKRIRVIGIDAPESYKPKNAKERKSGEIAKNTARFFLANKKVRLIYDIQANRKDRYGRILAHIETSDGLDFGREMLIRGSAKVWRQYKGDRREEYYLLAKEAYRTKQGLWAR